MNSQKRVDKIILILDLDGVLITNPVWRADQMHVDGYSAFNQSCVHNLNQLLRCAAFDIWLSSKRRINKTLPEFNQIFENRGIVNKIVGFLPECPLCRSRKEEILRFVADANIYHFLIVDDDKSLNGLEEVLKSRLILTDLMKGFDAEKLGEAIGKVRKMVGAHPE